MSPKEKYSNHKESLLIFIILISFLPGSCYQQKESSVRAEKATSIIKVPVVSGPLVIDGKPEDLSVAICSSSDSYQS